jgi:acetyl esterase/lipase
MIFYRILKTNYYLKLLLVFCLVFCVQNTFSQQSIENKNSFTVYENLQFSETDQQLTLDLFVPDELSEPVPCIIVVQGGGFKSQDGQRFRHYAEYIAKSNYAAALISYRGKPDYTYKTTIKDIKSAVRYIRHKSSEYLINPDKVGAMGKSAGGTLAALLAVTEDNSFDKRVYKVSGKVQAAVVYAGVFNFITRFSDSAHIALQPDADIRRLSNGEWIGHSFSKNNKHWKNVSPINHLDKNDPPVLFMHCKDDTSVPWLQSQEMYNKMKALEISSDILYFEQGGHGFQLENKELCLYPMMAFFKKQFD